MRGSGYHIENINMAACGAFQMTHVVVLFLPFYNVLTMKVNIGGTSHVCVSGSQVLHVNFGNGPIQHCDVMNTTPASKAKPSGTEKAKGQAKSFQGLCVSAEERVLDREFIVLDYLALSEKFPFTDLCWFAFSRYDRIRPARARDGREVNYMLSMARNSFL